MIHRYKLLLLLFVLSGLTACTKNNYWDSGISIGRHDCTLLEYMEMPGHSYDWDSTALMVRHAGEDMVRLFSGKDPDYPEITFFGFTNHSIRRYMIKKRIKQVSDLDPAWCREKLLGHIVSGKIYKNDVPRGIPISNVAQGEDGTTYTSLAGTLFWACTFAEAYQGIAGKGPVTLYLSSLTVQKKLTVASSDIEPNNCVVHSLHYDYTLGDI